MRFYVVLRGVEHLFIWQTVISRSQRLVVEMAFDARRCLTARSHKVAGSYFERLTLLGGEVQMQFPFEEVAVEPFVGVHTRRVRLQVKQLDVFAAISYPLARSVGAVCLQAIHAGKHLWLHVMHQVSEKADETIALAAL